MYLIVTKFVEDVQFIYNNINKNNSTLKFK